MILANHGIIASSGMITTTLNESLFAVYNAENNTNDSFGTNNGTAYGGTTYTTGKIGQAFNLNGTNSYIELPNNIFNFQEFSYSQWVYYKAFATPESYTLTATNGNSINENYGVSFGVISSKLSLAALNNTNISIWQSSTLSINQWYLLTVTKKSSEAPKFYVNGSLQPTTLLVGTNTLNPAYTGGSYTNSLCSIGTYRFNNGSNAYAYANALIDCTNVWNRELTAIEITDLYNSGNGKQYPF